MFIVFSCILIIATILLNVCGVIAIKDLLYDGLIIHGLLAIVLTIISDIGMVIFYIAFGFGNPWG